jgi:biotin carboxylase
VRTLLFLGASVSQLPAIRHARAAGHRVVAVDGDPAAVGFTIADDCVCVDFSDVDEVLSALASTRIDGVLAISSDRAVVPAARIAAVLGLPGIGVDVARAMTDKPEMRARLAQHDVPQPAWTVLPGGDPTGVPLPAVLKPADSGGQRGLSLVRRRRDIARHLKHALVFSSGGRAMLEEYVEGTELNGILVVRDGEPTVVTFSDRLRPRGPGFGVGWIHSFPPSVSDVGLGRARDVAFAAVRALGLRDGIAFPQVIVRGDEAWLVEIAARIAAGQMADLVRFATGVELFDVAIRQALGEPVPDELIAPADVRPVAIRFLTAKPGVLPLGTVTQIAGLDEVRRSAGVLAAGVYFAAGTRIGPLRVDADRRGYVVATGDTPQAALANADAAARRLVVRTRRPERARLVIPAAAAAVAAVAAVVALLLFPAPLRPRLLEEKVRALHGTLQVRYRFNEPVRTMLLADGRLVASNAALARAGVLAWRERRHHRLVLEGVDRSGRRDLVPLV